MAVTFRSLSDTLGYAPPPDGPTPLESWYYSVYDVPIGQLSVADLAVSVRQDVFLEEVLPIVYETLRGNPVAGERYDGELMASLVYVRPRYWEEHPDHRLQAIALVQTYPEILDEDRRQRIQRLLGV